MDPAKPLLVSVALCLAASGCGGGDDFGTFGDVLNAAPTSAEVAPSETEAGEELPFAVVESCEGEPTEISVGTPVTGELVSGDDLPLPTQFYCIVAPEGVTTLTIELSGLKVDLNLFSAYGSVDELGGGVRLQTSLNSGVEAERIVIDPPAVRGELGGFDQLEHIIPGAYYIEVSGIGFDEATTFTLSVSAT